MRYQSILAMHALWFCGTVSIRSDVEMPPCRDESKTPDMESIPSRHADRVIFGRQERDADFPSVRGGFVIPSSPLVRFMQFPLTHIVMEGSHNRKSRFLASSNPVQLPCSARSVYIVLGLLFEAFHDDVVDLRSKQSRAKGVHYLRGNRHIIYQQHYRVHALIHFPFCITTPTMLGLFLTLWLAALVAGLSPPCQLAINADKRQPKNLNTHHPSHYSQAYLRRRTLPQVCYQTCLIPPPQTPRPSAPDTLHHRCNRQSLA